LRIFGNSNKPRRGQILVTGGYRFKKANIPLRLSLSVLRRRGSPGVFCSRGSYLHDHSLHDRAVSLSGHPANDTHFDSSQGLMTKQIPDKMELPEEGRHQGKTLPQRSAFDFPEISPDTNRGQHRPRQ
jgi:hypothetical protein